jgi:hypothetical protein
LPGNIGRVDRLGHHALETELAGVFQDEFTVAYVVAVELKAGLTRDQGLKEGFALDEGNRGDIATVEMQEIEGVIDEPHSALAVGRRLEDNISLLALATLLNYAWFRSRCTAPKGMDVDMPPSTCAIIGGGISATANTCAAARKG